MNPPETRYALSDGVHIAWQAIGDAPLDLVFVHGWFSNVEVVWENPWQSRFLERLASFARVVLFDKRGTGLSDRDTPAFALEDRMDDVRAVMDAAGSRRAVLVGTSEGGPMCALFAATYPERVQALVMIGSYARRIRCPDYPWGSAPEAYDALVEKMEAGWGRGIDIAARAPSLAGDPRFVKHYERYLRMSASPATAVGYARMNGQIDVRDDWIGAVNRPQIGVEACPLASYRLPMTNLGLRRSSGGTVARRSGVKGARRFTGHVPPAELEAAYYAQTEESALAG